MAPLNQKLTVNATGGQFVFNVGKACTITSDNVEIIGSPESISFYSRNDDTTYITLKDITATATSQMMFANGSNGRYIIEDGVTLNTKEFYLNGKIADVTFRTGSTLTGSSFFKLGNNAAATSPLVLDGGTIDLTTQSTLGWVWMGVNANQVDFTVNAGTLTTWGILCRTGWKDPATFGEQFTMNGGTLNITGDAIRGWTHFNHFCEFNGGTVNSLANWHVEQMRSSGFGSRPGGLVTLQLNDKTVNWATGLAGAADVQLKGNGTLKSGTGEKSTKLFMRGAKGWARVFQKKGIEGGLRELLRKNIAGVDVGEAKIDKSVMDLFVGILRDLNVENRRWAQDETLTPEDIDQARSEFVEGRIDKFCRETGRTVEDSQEQNELGEKVQVQSDKNKLFTAFENVVRNMFFRQTSKLGLSFMNERETHVIFQWQNYDGQIASDEVIGDKWWKNDQADIHEHYGVPITTSEMRHVQARNFKFVHRVR